MQRAIGELGVRGWISGLRRQQAKSRVVPGALRLQDGIVKIHPIIDWTDQMVYQYMTKHDLPFHPLWEKGYVSLGDVHATRPISAEPIEEKRVFSA